MSDIKPNSLQEASRLANQIPVTDLNFKIFYYLIDALQAQQKRIKELERLVSVLNSENSLNRPLK